VWESGLFLARTRGAGNSKRKMPGRFAEGPRHPGLYPARSAVSEQENRKITLQRNELPSFFVASRQEFRKRFDGPATTPTDVSSRTPC